MSEYQYLVGKIEYRDNRIEVLEKENAALKLQNAKLKEFVLGLQNNYELLKKQVAEVINENETLRKKIEKWKEFYENKRDGSFIMNDYNKEAGK